MKTESLSKETEGLSKEIQNIKKNYAENFKLKNMKVETKSSVDGLNSRMEGMGGGRSYECEDRTTEITQPESTENIKKKRIVSIDKPVGLQQRI